MILTCENVPPGTVVRVDGKLIPNAVEVDVFGGVVAAYKTGPDGEVIIGPDGDLARVEHVGQVTVEFPKPERKDGSV